jgi:hypothetical protein
LVLRRRRAANDRNCDSRKGGGTARQTFGHGQGVSRIRL